MNHSSCAVAIDGGVQNEKQHSLSGAARENKPAPPRKLKQSVSACWQTTWKLLKKGILQLRPGPAPSQLCGIDWSSRTAQMPGEKRKEALAIPNENFSALPSPFSPRSQRCSCEQPWPQAHSLPAGQGQKTSQNLGSY